MSAKTGLIGSRLTLLRHSMMFSGANVIGVAVGAGATAVAAVMLGPEAFGIIATMQLVLLGASLLRLGVCTAAAREIPSLLAEGREADARALQNTAFVTEMLMAVVVGCLIAIVGTARFADPTVRTLVLIVAIGHIVSTAQVYLVELHWAHGRYAQISQNVLLLKVLTAALTVAGAWAIGIPGVLLATVVATAVVVGAYLLFAPALHLRVSVDRSTFGRLLARGLPLAFAVGAFSLGRQVERFVLVGAITAHELGLYAFAANLVVLAQGVVIDFGSVVQVPMYRHLGAGADPATVIEETTSLNRMLVLAAAVGATLAQIAFAPVALLFFPAYGGSVAVLEILAVIIVTAAISVVPTLLLRSPAVDRLYSLGVVQATLVVLQAGMTLAAIRIWPHWLVGASCAVVCAECATSAGLLWLLRHARGVSIKSDWPSLASSAMCVGVVATLAALYQLPAFAPSVHGIFLALVARLAGAVGVWAIATLIFFGSRTPQLIPAWREALPRSPGGR